MIITLFNTNSKSQKYDFDFEQNNLYFEENYRTLGFSNEEKKNYLNNEISNQNEMWTYINNISIQINNASIGIQNEKILWFTITIEIYFHFTKWECEQVSTGLKTISIILYTTSYFASSLPKYTLQTVAGILYGLGDWFNSVGQDGLRIVIT